DSDGDTFTGADDKCPNEPENFDGVEDDDGCPEPPGRAGAAPGKPLAELVTVDGRSTLRLSGALGFDASDAVLPASRSLLRAIASVAKQNQLRLIVGGRPSPQRKDQAQKRSFAVAQELRGFIGSDGAVQVVDWERVRGASLAEVFGVGIALP